MSNDLNPLIAAKNAIREVLREHAGDDRLPTMDNDTLAAICAKAAQRHLSSQPLTDAAERLLELHDGPNVDVRAHDAAWDALREAAKLSGGTAGE